jgi:pimeloyl-ACP methyl ester carboxylesterase
MKQSHTLKRIIMNRLELKIPGLSIAYRTWGDANNPPILALHGWLDNANSFESIAEYLAEYFYFIAVDLPGHGFSSHIPEGMHYHFIDGLFTIVQIIEALKVNSVHLLGHSLGACLGSLVAGIAPQYIISLSLIEALGPLTRPQESSAIQLKQYLTFLHSPTTHSKGYKDINSAALIRASKGYVSFEIAEKLCERGLIEEDGVYYWRHDRRLLSPSPLQMTEAQVISCLKQIQAKTLLIQASDGFSFSNELMEKRIDAVQNLTVQHYNGGHHIHMEQPKAVSEHLLAFYGSLKEHEKPV